MQLDEQQRGLLERAEQAAKPSAYCAGMLDALRRETSDPQERERIDRVLRRHEEAKQ